MADRSSIEWTDATWNPVTGCTKVSPGCKNCYAERFAERWRGIPGHPYENGFDLTLRPDRLTLPTQWQRPRMIFVNSTSDLFHEAVPTDYIRRVFDVMGAARQHVFQVLTKRADRLAHIAHSLVWSTNIWQGVSVENAAYVNRIAYLQLVPAAIRFLSVEPLLGPIPNLPLEGIGWVIVGGESGPGARPMREEWVLSIRDQCRRAGVPFFFKQWGGVFKKATGRELDGHTYDEMPAAGLEMTPLFA